MPTSLPSGTVTFLFTDIEGSTKLAREHPQEWEGARVRHHSILGEAIESNRGYVFQIIGDAFCAAFHTAGDALRAAIQAQRDLQTSEVLKTSEVSGLRVRMDSYWRSRSAQRRISRLSHTQHDSAPDVRPARKGAFNGTNRRKAG